MSVDQAPYHTRARQNGQHNGHDPITALQAGAEIENQYRTSAEILFAAILREPHIFAANAHKMHPYWWSETRYKRCAELLFRQFYSPAKQYSAYSVVLSGDGVTESHLLGIQNKHIDTPLDLSLDVFLPTYRRWVEHRASLLAQAGISQGLEAETIRRNQDEYRQRSCAYIAQVEPDGAALEKWVEAKLSGNEIEYPCRPHLNGLRRNGIRAYEPSQLIVIGARPGMGKTHFVLGESHGFARSGVRGIFFSLEMSRFQIEQRMVGVLSDMNPQASWINISQTETDAVLAAKDFLRSWPVRVIDNVCEISEMQSILHAEHFREPFGYVIVDYLQIVRAKGYTGEGEISEVSKRLKQFSRDFSCPVIAVAQLNRALEGRADKRPQLADLRGSGQVEQDADLVMFLYRPEYYGIQEWEDGKKTQGTGEIIVAKNRAGGLFRPERFNFCGIKGYSDIAPSFSEFDPAQPKFETVDFSAARPKNDQDVPF